jgi:hypothetical protein
MPDLNGGHCGDDLYFVGSYGVWDEEEYSTNLEKGDLLKFCSFSQEH